MSTMTLRTVMCCSFLSMHLGCTTATRGNSRSPSSIPFNEPKAVTISTAEQFAAMAIGSDGLVKGGQSVKFLIDLRSTISPSRPDIPNARVHFMNANYLARAGGTVESAQRYHYDFSKRWLGNRMGQLAFNNSTYFSKTLNERLFIAGTIQTYQFAVDGRSQFYYGIQFYPQDAIREEMIQFAVKMVRESFQIPAAQMAFISYGATQTVTSVRAALGIPAFEVNDVLGNLPFIVMNHGEAWGRIRIKPADPGTLLPIDIPVFAALPLDLSVVAGAMTYEVQDSGSHINLKSKERKTPDVVIRDPALRAELEAMDGAYVHWVVAKEKYVKPEITTREKVEEAYRARVRGTPVRLLMNARAELLAFDEMCPVRVSDCLDNSSYGGKATKLGFLGHPEVLGKTGAWVRDNNYKYRMTPIGFGIPLNFYADFVNANATLKEALSKFITKESTIIPITEEELTQRSRDRIEELGKIQKLFYVAKFPPAQIAKLKVQLDKMVQHVKREYSPDFPDFKIKKVKVRSSANTEDVPGFDGAGLHESFGAKIKAGELDTTFADTDCAVEASGTGVTTKFDMVPETFTCAIKGVYASLWNKRAVEERGHHHLDHTTAAMGIAVNPSYDLLKKQGIGEVGNSVVVTRVLNTTSIYGYSLSGQIGDNLVTNPTPETQSETAIATFLVADEPIGLTYLQYARPHPTDAVRTTPLFSVQRMNDVVHIAQHVEKVYCLRSRNYNTNPSAAGDCDFTLTDPDKSKSLDMEFKYLGEETNPRRRIMIKQMREFAGH